jgi:hypothetical protein
LGHFIAKSKDFFLSKYCENKFISDLSKRFFFTSELKNILRKGFIFIIKILLLLLK